MFATDRTALESCMFEKKLYQCSDIVGFKMVMSRKNKGSYQNIEDLYFSGWISVKKISACTKAKMEKYHQIFKKEY